LFEKKRKNISNLLIHYKDQLENKLKQAWLTIIHTKREINNIIFGLENTYVLRNRERKKLHLQNAILNLMLDILQLIFLIKRVEHFIAYSLREDAVRMELIVNIITGSPILMIVMELIKQRIYLVDPVLVHIDKI